MTKPNPETEQKTPKIPFGCREEGIGEIICSSNSYRGHFSPSQHPITPKKEKPGFLTHARENIRTTEKGYRYELRRAGITA